MKRLDAESYKYKGDTSCASGFKVCGEYCVKGTTDCEAVTKIEIDTTCADATKDFSIGGKCIKLTKDLKFNPIVNFIAAITQNDTPNDKEYPCLEWTSRLPAKQDVSLAYPLLKIRETGCEKEKETKKYQSMYSDSTKFATELNVIEVMEFYSDYQVGNFATKMFEAEKRPSLYKESYTSNDKATLYYLSKIPIATYNDNCLIAYAENYDDTVQVSDVLRKTYKYCNFILIFLCALGLLMCIGYLILRRKNIKKDGILIAIYVIAFLVVFLCILQACLHWYWLSSRDIKDYYGNISSRSKNDCYSETRLDAPYKNIISYIYSIYKPVEPFVIVLFV